MIHLDTVLWDQYQIERFIGEGPSGSVYQAQDLARGARVAVKRLRASFLRTPKELEQRLQPARAAGALAHPSAVQIYRHGEDYGRYFILSEWIEGSNLEKQLRSFPGTLEDKLELLKKCLAALRVAHEHGLAHGNLKPTNVFMTSDGEIKVSDFGMSVVSGAAPFLNTAHTLFRAYDYCAPEQLAGGGVDTRTDVYVLGILGYELLSEHAYLELPNAALTAEAIAQWTPRALPPHIPSAIAQVVMCALAKDPSGRFRNVGTFQHALEVARLAPESLTRELLESAQAPSAVFVPAAPEPVAGSISPSPELGETLVPIAPDPVAEIMPPAPEFDEMLVPVAPVADFESPAPNIAEPRITAPVVESEKEKERAVSVARPPRTTVVWVGLVIVLTVIGGLTILNLPRLLTLPNSNAANGAAGLSETQTASLAPNTPVTATSIAALNLTSLPATPTRVTATPIIIQATATLAATAPPEPTITPLPPTPSGRVLALGLLEPFQSARACAYGLQNDAAYHVGSNADQTICGAVFSETFSDLRLDARLKTLQGDGIGGGHTMLIFGYQSPKDFFAVTFTRVGRLYGVAHWQDNVPQSVVVYSWAQDLARPNAEGITQDEITLKLIGKQLTLSANGALVNVHSLETLDYKGGKVGVGLYTLGASPSVGGESALEQIRVQALP